MVAELHGGGGGGGGLVTATLNFTIEGHVVLTAQLGRTAIPGKAADPLHMRLLQPISVH